MKLTNHSNHCVAAIRAAALALLLGAALPLAAQAATRDPLVQPFAIDSIWNMPIGTGAQYVAINMAADPSNDVWAPMPQIDDEYIFLDSTAPLTNINYSDAAWTGRDRCNATGGLLFQAPFPTNYVVPSNMGNNSAVFLMPDNRTLIHSQPITRCVAGGPATSVIEFSGVDIYGDGRYGSHGGSALSAIGGSIRLGEFRPGIPVRHTIKIDVDSPVVLARCSSDSDCFRWPAFTADAGAPGSYGTQNPNPVPGMKMGALLAIPTSTNINNLGLESVPGQMLAWTLQNYGAYIVDTTGGPSFTINAETGPNGSKRDQFKADFGMDFEQRVNSNTPWSRDMQRLVQALYLVANNGPTSIGGGGTPLQPLALPLQLPGGSDTIPPTVPGGLTATVASLQINLSWTASTDNVGVAGYKIFRNGTQVATTSSLTYADAGLLPLTLYNYAVAAFDAAGNTSAQSAVVSASTLAAPDTIVPSVPAGLVGTAVSSSQVNLSWNPSTDNVGVTGYYVYLNDVALTTTTATSFQHTGLTAGTTYNYRVSSYDAAGNNSAWTATPVSVTTPFAADTVAPSVPAGLTATAVSSTQINLSWTASTDNVGVTGYRVYRAGTLLVTLGAVTTYQNTGLSASTSYSYTVQAIDAAGNASAQSVSASATTQAAADTVAPSTPTGLLASAVSSSQINLSWTASTDNVGVTGYRVYRAGALLVTLGAVTTYQNTGLSASTSYSYTVQAIDAAGNASAQSASASATTQAAPDTIAPSVPTGLTGTAVSSTQINLTWNPSTDNVAVASYQVYLNDALMANTTVTSFQHTGLTPGTTYNYRVTAADAVPNYSAWTATPVSVTTPAAADTVAPSTPTGLLASAVSSSQINLSWTASADNVGVTGYRVYRAGALLATLGAVTTYQNTGLTASTTYSYTVQAVDAAGNASAQSVSASATTLAAADTVAPTTPTGLSASAVSSSLINLSWAASTDNMGVTGYRVYRAGALLATLGAVSIYQNTGLTPSTTYSYTVQSFDAAGNASAQSVSASATTQAAPDTEAPSVPTGLKGRAVSPTQINLTWNASTDNVGVTGYYVYLNGVPLATTTTTSFQHTGLTAGTTYRYRVSAYDAVPNNSTWTAPVWVRTTRRRIVGADFNGDGMSDILWRNSTTGQNAIWLMNGTTLSSNAPISTVTDLNWSIAGIGDFDGNGKSDILWRNRATGEDAIWLMNGTTVTGGGQIPTEGDLNWSIAGVGDFDGNGKSDILWRHRVTGENAIWLVNGTGLSGGGLIPTEADLNWSIAGVGDFDGDSKADILWRNRATGENAIWFVNGTTLSGGGPIPAVTDLNWSIAGVGDFDGDGKSDILWRNNVTGENMIWLVNGTALSSSVQIATQADLNWSIAGVEDFDGDGKPDILWRNSTTGQDAIWLMNGTTFSSSVSINTVQGAGWAIAR